MESKYFLEAVVGLPQMRRPMAGCGVKEGRGYCVVYMVRRRWLRIDQVQLVVHVYLLLGEMKP